jgi:aminoglycoside phosphotransferase (APT) family kinase protein
MQDNSVDDVAKHGQERLQLGDIAEWKSRLERFMNARGYLQDPVTVSDLSRPSGGASSGTIIFKATHSVSGANEKLVLRFHTDATHANYSDIPGQYRLLKALHPTSVPVPRVIDLDETGQYLGVPAYLMEFVDATALPNSYHFNGALFDAPPEVRREMVREAMGIMAALHNLDWRAMGLDRFTRTGEGRDVMERDMAWYWRALNWGAPECVPVAEPVHRWILEHQVEPKVLSLCHGDASLHNYMFKAYRVSAVVDWEFAFINAPEVDLAYFFGAYDVLGIGAKPLEGVPDMAGCIAMYEEQSGRSLDNWDYYHMVGRYKLYIHMLLSFRGVPPELEAMRDKFVSFAWERLQEAWDKAKR